MYAAMDDDLSHPFCRSSGYGAPRGCREAGPSSMKSMTAHKTIDRVRPTRLPAWLAAMVLWLCLDGTGMASSADEEVTASVDPVQTRFYWPKYGCADVVVEEIDGDRRMRYSMEVYVTPHGEDESGRCIRPMSHELQRLDGMAVNQANMSSDQALMQFALNLCPARYVDADGAYRGTEDPSKLVRANMDVAERSGLFADIDLARLRRVVDTTRFVRGLRRQARQEVDEWGGHWRALELEPNVAHETRVTQRTRDGDEVSFPVVYLWQYESSEESDDEDLQTLWYRARITGPALGALAEHDLLALGFSPATKIDGEQLVTVSIRTNPYTLIPHEVVSQYDTTVRVGGEERTYHRARKVTFEWRQGKERMTQATGDEADG
jgi:hypothetical protein